MSEMIERPHFDWPFALGHHVEQGTKDHVDARAHNLIACPIGFLEHLPEFGWPSPEFQNAPLDTAVLETALRRWIGRDVTLREYADAAGASIRHISIDVDSGETSV